MPYIFQAMRKKYYGLKSGIKKDLQNKQKTKNVHAKQGLSLDKKQDQQGVKDRVANMEDICKDATIFNLEHEIIKIKIPIPLN